MNNLNLSLESRLSNISSNIQNANEEVVDKVMQVDINKLSRNDNNFYNEEYEIETLAESIKENGLIQPLHITKDYKIISGHRRYNALKMVGIDKVKCIFVDDSVDYTVQLIEANRHRVKSEEEVLKEVQFLEEHYKNLELRGQKPKGRMRDLIANGLGVSPATAQRKLAKVKKQVSNDTNEKKEESIELQEFTKLKKHLNKIIKLHDNGKIEVSEYVLEKIYKLRDHINISDIDSIVDDKQMNIDIE